VSASVALYRVVSPAELADLRSDAFWCGPRERSRPSSFDALFIEHSRTG